MVLLRDITDRKKAEEALKQYTNDLAVKNLQLDATRQELSAVNEHLEQMVKQRTAEVEKLLVQKDEFIYQLGHDLMNPLTPLITLLPILRDEEQDPKRKDLLEATVDNVQFIQNLVHKTLQLARLKASISKIKLGKTPLRDYIEIVLQPQEALVQEKDLTITLNINEDICVQADRIQIQELLDNLLNNAIKFTPEGGTITLSCQEKDNWITVSVSDTGQGMDEKQLSRIFDEFYKADPSRHDLDSSGLGLSIAKLIVEAHGGKIWAESPGLGKGCTVFFTLPLSPSSSQKEEAHA